MKLQLMWILGKEIYYHYLINCTSNENEFSNLYSQWLDTVLYCIVTIIVLYCHLEHIVIPFFRTDSIIKEVIGEKFLHCTILAIAHRLDTVMDSDKILVRNMA